MWNIEGLKASSRFIATGSEGSSSVVVWMDLFEAHSSVLSHAFVTNARNCH